MAGASGAWETARFVALCSVWLACSSSIVLVNKLIIKELNFAFPIAVSALGQGTSFLVAWAICEAAERRKRAAQGERKPADQQDADAAELRPLKQSGAEGEAAPAAEEGLHKQQQDGSSRAPEVPGTISMHLWMWRVMPVGIAQGVGIYLSNQLYLLLTVAFIEMARALLPLLTLLALWGTGLKIPDRAQISAVILSAVGCGISAYGEARLTVAGIICLGINFGVEIVRMVLLQYLIQELKLGPWQTVRAVTGPASGSLLVLMVLVEGRTMVRVHAEQIIIAYWPVFAMAATLGIGTNFITNLVVQYSSATTVKLLAAIRGPLVVLCGVLLFAELVAEVQLFGYALALCGFVWYSMATSGPSAAAQPGSKGAAAGVAYTAAASSPPAEHGADSSSVEDGSKAKLRPVSDSGTGARRAEG